MAVGGMVNCIRCGSAWAKPDGVNFGTIRITRCPNCGIEQPPEPVVAAVPGPLPWAIPPTPADTEDPAIKADRQAKLKAALDEVLAEVAADEKDWIFNDKLDMAVRIEEERKKRERHK